MFHMDPVEVMTGGYYEWAVRIAAKRYIAEELEKQRPKTKK